MGEQDNFFTRNQGRLLNIAIWAKYLSWIALLIFAFSAVVEFIQNQYTYSYQFQRQAIFSEMLKDQPLFALNTILNIASVLLKGIVYYLMLKGISLGLNMIVETDINYREQKKYGGEL